MAIYGLCVSFDFVDILENTIEHNKKILTEFIVVTKIDDKKTKECCDKYNVKWFEMDIDRNKGEMINAALTYYYLKVPESRNNWFLIFDSDILLPKEIKKYNLVRLDPQALYGCHRVLLKDEEELLSFIKNGEIDFEKAKEEFQNRKPKRGKPGIGYFQLFHKRKFYIATQNKIESSDMSFKRSFKKIYELRTVVLHLGTPYINWKERVEKKWEKVL